MTVTIEPLAAAHADALLRLAQDPQLATTSSVPLDCTRAHVDGWIAENRVEPVTTLTFAILADGAVVGAVTLKRLDAPDHSGELSYWIGTEHQRKGYATAAARLAVEHGHHSLLLDRIHAHYLKGANPASGKVLLDGCGFEPDPGRADLAVDGRFADAFPGDHWTFVHRPRPPEVPLGPAAREHQRQWDQMMSAYCGGRASCLDLAVELIHQTQRRSTGAPLRVLDVGCGSGSFVHRLLAEQRLAPLSITGVDGSARSLLLAAALSGEVGATRFERADIGSPGWGAAFEAESFDVVFLGWVTHEIEPWRLASLYEGIGRVLRPGGLLLNADFMRNQTDGLSDLAREYQRRRVSPAAAVRFAAFNDRLDRLPQVAAAIELDRAGATRTNWYVSHAPSTHIELLGAEGFKEAGEIWRYLGYSMVMGIR